MALSVFLTVMVMLAAYQIVQNVGAVHDVFYPRMMVVVSPSKTALPWEPLQIEGSAYLNFDRFFFKKSIANDANSKAPAILRVCDTGGTVIADSFLLAPGTSASLAALHGNEDYILEMQPCDGTVVLTIY